MARCVLDRGDPSVADVMDSIEKEMNEMAHYHDLLEIVDTYFPKDYDGKDTKELING